MNKIFKKVIKGTLAILTIKLILVTGIFISQSCQSDSIDNEIQEKAKTNFLSSLRQSNLSLNTVKFKSPKAQNGDNIMGRNMGGTTETICLIAIGDPDPTSEDVFEGISTITELLASTEQLNLTTKFPLMEITDDVLNGESTDEDIDDETYTTTEYCFEIPLQPVVDALEPTIEGAKNYLISKGLTNSDIQNLFTADADGSAMEEYNLVPIVMMLVAEEQNTNTTASINFASVFANTAYASTIGKCAGDALGVSAIAAVLQQGVGTAAGKALLKKAIRKVATRALGWIGAAVFVYEFGDCMDWW